MNATMTNELPTPTALAPAMCYGADLKKQEAQMLELCWMVTPAEGKAKMRREHLEAIKALEECLGRPLRERHNDAEFRNGESGTPACQPERE